MFSRRIKKRAMIDISGKEPTTRMAVAVARVRLSAEALEAVRTGMLPKGPAQEVARLAGIMAAKKCSELIPFCHQVPLDQVQVEVAVGRDCVEIRATARARAATGVEMEALTAVAIAALTIYDMCKALDPAATITDVRVLRKTGGKHGDWAFEEEEPCQPADE
ncbi:MAG: cyclic pyranopterin monophosphate synthase MoaC [Armatimonadetes bacterium]|nr:cyclic pyranopterin monophosphate synthase MoaC [Armatimonadota bacterium]